MAVTRRIHGFEGYPQNTQKREETFTGYADYTNLEDSVGELRTAPVTSYPLQPFINHAGIDAPESKRVAQDVIEPFFARLVRNHVEVTGRVGFLII